MRVPARFQGTPENTLFEAVSSRANKDLFYQDGWYTKHGTYRGALLDQYCLKSL